MRMALRGLLLWLGLFLSAFLVLAMSEHFFRFNSQVRTVLFWTYCLSFLTWLVAYVLIPVLRMQRWIKSWSDEDAARQIGRYQKGLDDKLLNTLGLSKVVGSNQALVLAAIEQKAAEFAKLDFKSFVDFGSLKRLLPISLVPLLLLGLIALSEEGRELISSSKRIVLYDQDFKAPAPFSFILESTNYTLESGKGISIPLKVEGRVLPERIEASIGGVRRAAIKRSASEWELRLDRVASDQSLRFEAMSYSSDEIQIKVFQSPSFSALNVELNPPNYTGIVPSQKALEPDLLVPEGTKLNIKVAGLSNTERVLFRTEHGERLFEDIRLEITATSDLNYDIQAEGAGITKTLLRGATIRVSPDQKPSIKAAFSKDSNLISSYWVELDYSDDYGISRLERVIKQDQGEEITSLLVGEFYDRINLDSLGETGGSLEIYYRVWDNDAVNGSKMSRSQGFRISLLSQEEQENQSSNQIKSYRSKLEEQSKKSLSLQESLESLDQAFNENKRLEWQDKQDIKDLLQKLEAKNEMLKAEREKLKEDLEKLDAPGDQKEQIQERLEEMSEQEKELEKLKEEIQKLMEDLNMQDLQEKLQELQEENQQQMRQEERLDDLLKDLLFQRDLLKEAQNLQNLAERLKELSEKQVDEKAAQEELEEQFEESVEKLEEMSQENKQLEDLMSSSEFQKEQKEAEQNLSEASQEMSEGQDSEANDKQEDASENMEEMSESLSLLMSSMQKQALEVNMESVRRILENLKQYSIDVEESGLAIQDLARQDPRFRDLLKEQSRLMAGSKVIQDSLTVLSEKAPQVKEAVFKELSAMQKSLSKAQKELQEQAIAKSSTEHQYSMMAANNLALMLDESLQNMMSMMAQQKKGKQNCEKPGQGKPKPGQMSKKMSQMGQKVERLQKGTKDGKGKPGQGKEMTQVLAEQEALRQMFEQMEDGELGPHGNKEGLLEELDRMEDALLEEDYNQVLERFKRIETRLLESEKAFEERKQKEDREAESSEDLKMRMGEDRINVLPEIRKQYDRFRRRSLKLKGFYRELGSE